jgi:hypothetical protein
LGEIIRDRGTPRARASFPKKLRFRGGALFIDHRPASMGLAAECLLSLWKTKLTHYLFVTSARVASRIALSL